MGYNQRSSDKREPFKHSQVSNCQNIIAEILFIELLKLLLQKKSGSRKIVKRVKIETQEAKIILE